VEVEPIDAVDRETVARILALDPWPEPRPARAPIRTATRDEIDAHWHGASADGGLYSGSIELLDVPAAFALGEQRGVTARITNRSTHVWPPGAVGWPSVRVTYRWLDDAGAVLVPDGLRTPLPAALAPETSLLVPVQVLAPPLSGTHTLVLDLLHEHVRWFGCELPVAVAVRPARCVAILAEDESVAAAAAAALAEVAPAVRPLVLSAGPARVTELHGYAAAPEPRGYVLGSRDGRNGALGTAGALTRAAALLGDAALRRVGRRARLAGPEGVAYLDGLTDADALLVVGDQALRGARGEREALQQGAALAAASALGLAVVVVSTSERPGPIVSRVVETVRLGPGGDLTRGVAEAVRRLDAEGP
jgi:hypothetical protein